VGSWQFPDGVIKYFLKEMNSNAGKLKMFQTNFDSPHGLANKYNYSTAYDLCLLTHKCMQIPLFREVVYTCCGSLKSD
jgi:serine-type D-Ala-D-Ala carboxypeptidase (penicillin-binding protein 5/6)